MLAHVRLGWIPQCIESWDSGMWGLEQLKTLPFELRIETAGVAEDPAELWTSDKLRVMTREQGRS